MRLWKGLLVAGLACAVACGDDDDTNETMEPGDGDFRLVEVRFNGDDRFELQNDTDSSIDLSFFWYCANRGYGQIASLTVESGDLALASGASIVFSGLSLGDDSDLAIYASNSFSSASAMRAYVRWGTAAAANREFEAVEAGFWSAGESVDVSAIQAGESIAYDGDGDSASDWSIQSTPTLGN